MKRWLDRLLTGEVKCRNCPQWRQHLGGTGTCAREQPLAVPILGGGFQTALGVRLEDEWCAFHPLWHARQGEGLYYAPGAFAEEEKGFNRPPALHEALKYAPNNAENREAARAMHERLNDRGEQ